MKVIKYFVFLFAMFFAAMTVEAATITTGEYDGKIKLAGTGEGTVQIVLFDADNKPIYLTTAPTKDGKFEITLPEIEGLKTGDYNVKAADYDGKNLDEKIIKVVPINNTTNPKTGDSIYNIILIGCISFIGLISTVQIKKKIN